MTREASQQRTNLFTIRVWAEDLGATEVEWRGKVQLSLIHI